MKRKSGAILVIVSILLVFLSININKNNDDSINKLPQISIVNNESTTKVVINKYNFDSHKGKNNNKDKAIVQNIKKVKSNETIRIDFDKLPDEYNLSVNSIGNKTNVDIKNNTFTTPEKKGKYSYSIITRWYVEGTISYEFILEVI